MNKVVDIGRAVVVQEYLDGEPHLEPVAGIITKVCSRTSGGGVVDVVVVDKHGAIDTLAEVADYRTRVLYGYKWDWP